MSDDIISQCVYCGTDLTAETLTRDHVVPKIRGGYKGDRNIAPACGPCNGDKGLLTASEYLSVRDDPEDREALKRVIQREIDGKPPWAAMPSVSTIRAKARERSVQARRMQKNGECIRPLGFTVCTCDVCHPDRTSKVQASERFRLQQQPFKDLQL